jgi:hypothetical protein
VRNSQSENSADSRGLDNWAKGLIIIKSKTLRETPVLGI